MPLHESSKTALAVTCLASSLLLCLAAASMGACSHSARPHVVSAQAQRPPATISGPADEKLSAWLTAINAGDRAQIERVNAGAADSALLTSRALALVDRTGGFDQEHMVVVESSPSSQLVLAKARKTSLWQCLAFGVEAKPPHAIALMQVSPAEAPAAAMGAGQTAGSSLDERARREVIEALIGVLNNTYVYPEKAAAMERALRMRQAQHAYDGIENRVVFAQTLTADLQQVVKDRHMFLGVGCSTAVSPRGAARPGPPLATKIFGEVRRLEGNVAYIEITSFGAPAELVREEIQKTMSAAADASALILDLRRNPGGDPGTVALVSSYLFGDQRVHLNSLYSRETNSTEDYFTNPAVQGTKFGITKPVYVLTSGGTFSAAEEFAYNLQSLKRAVIVGETTGGGAHPGGAVPLPLGFSIRVPSGRAINPITKTNWEGTGVTPNVPAAAGTALEVAHRLALAASRASAR